MLSGNIVQGMVNKTTSCVSENFRKSWTDRRRDGQTDQQADKQQFFK